MIAVIGGSGLTRLPELSITHRQIVRTPYGEPSTPLLFGRLGSQDIVFLARHGFNHTLAPHEINYRANIWALHSAGAENIISISSVAGLHEGCPAGALVVPDDLIDYTNRPSTFFEGPNQAVVHTDFSYPYDNSLRQTLLQHAAGHDTHIISNAVYGCIQGPRWPTRAEVSRYRNDGVDIIGMSGMPEAILAREIGLPYIHLCGIIGLACTNGNMPDPCRHESNQALDTIRKLLVDL
ncbi:S-methyl-5'-thioinosine phosphorylase [Neisseria weaveri]|uniref:S-methyl-5'-thioinosine phosphorylase n=1 Tax=Neisseria weaveri TaxID=28091 RepID=A0A3S5C4I4_9NEIS|nr:S-methyl-5'-thioinosine phosphorylase [Neisseria weaveri]EGV35472.1 methylthioadenosine phosphorylase [Neisseria weaveri ATCC 51223]EGV37780.1 methylthioadenosine phosphorylase [Neisseria weaveri LMG 5135]SAY50440.1 S-methyl-5'-thioinosine phosphorylase [Neisseria weaveri]VEJ51849.1 S-methyl-5'-thioinosine phosphorylase [Neisseria weaveri]